MTIHLISIHFPSIYLEDICRRYEIYFPLTICRLINHLFISQPIHQVINIFFLNIRKQSVIKLLQIIILMDVDGEKQV